MQANMFDAETFDHDLVACRVALHAGSKSFAGAAKLLPRHVRDSATALYAFCREADDAVDLHPRGERAVHELRERLDRIYSGRPAQRSVDRAVCEVVRRHALPRLLLDSLIEGFQWDAEGRRYATISELSEYAVRVAGTIGVMMAIIMGARSGSALARACDLGVAMQLTNIARDVGEDARAGRIYLPLNAMRDAGIDPSEWLAQPRMSSALRMTIEGLLKEADHLYDGVASGVAQLPLSCRTGINAARFIYADIGRTVRAADCDSVSQRAVVSTPRKMLLAVKAIVALSGNEPETTAEPIAATRALMQRIGVMTNVEKRMPSLQLPALGAPFAWWRLSSRALWLFELLERTERRHRLNSSSR